MELRQCWSGAVERGFWHIRTDTIPVSTLSMLVSYYVFFAYRHCCFYATSNPSGNQRDPLRGVMLVILLVDMHGPSRMRGKPWIAFL